MIYPHDLKTLIVKPTLEYLGLYSEAAANLLMMTYAVESNIAGQTRLQQVNGPALGIYQIEPATHNDVYQHFLNYPGRHEFRNKIATMTSFGAGLNLFEDEPVPAEMDDQLVTNLQYTTAIARIIYYRDKEALPEADDIDGLAKYYKRVFNTPLGKSSEEKAKRAYREIM